MAQATIDNSGTHADFLEAVLQLQHDGQNERRRQTILWLSGLPVIKTLAQFDYAYASGVPRSQIQELAGLASIERQENVARLWRERRCCAASGVCMTGAPLYTLLHAYPPSR
ncbi:ATP-binding protein [Candidatus Erwinia dacicola]